jgi:hypothetical protein
MEPATTNGSEATAEGGRDELWQRSYRKTLADSQRALAGMVDRTQSYERALVNERVPTRLGDGSVDVEVAPGLFSSFRANWLRQPEPGARASVGS